MAQAIADEVVTHIQQPDGKSAIGWYDRALKAAEEQYYEFFPELKTDKNKEMVFDAILGIASQGNDVHSNSVYAARMYQLFRSGKTIPDAANILKGSFSRETVAIENSYEKLATLLDKKGHGKRRKPFNTTVTLRE
jgi:uncharacterized glyoxalase superfamily protein PhnB